MDVGPFNANLEKLTAEQIEDILLQLDVGGRFDGDIEYLHLVQKEIRTVEEIERMRQLLRESGVSLGFRI